MMHWGVNIVILFVLFAQSEVLNAAKFSFPFFDKAFMEKMRKTSTTTAATITTSSTTTPVDVVDALVDEEEGDDDHSSAATAASFDTKHRDYAGPKPTYAGVPAIDHGPVSEEYGRGVGDIVETALPVPQQSAHNGYPSDPVVQPQAPYGAAPTHQSYTPINPPGGYELPNKKVLGKGAFFSGNLPKEHHYGPKFQFMKHPFLSETPAPNTGCIDPYGQGCIPAANPSYGPQPDYGAPGYGPEPGPTYGSSPAVDQSYGSSQPQPPDSTYGIPEFRLKLKSLLDSPEPIDESHIIPSEREAFRTQRSGYQNRNHAPPPPPPPQNYPQPPQSTYGNGNSQPRGGYPTMVMNNYPAPSGGYGSAAPQARTAETQYNVQGGNGYRQATTPSYGQPQLTPSHSQYPGPAPLPAPYREPADTSSYQTVNADDNIGYPVAPEPRLTYSQPNQGSYGERPNEPSYGEPNEPSAYGQSDGSSYGQTNELSYGAHPTPPTGYRPPQVECNPSDPFSGCYQPQQQAMPHYGQPQVHTGYSVDEVVITTTAPRTEEVHTYSTSGTTLAPSHYLLNTPPPIYPAPANQYGPVPTQNNYDPMVPLEPSHYGEAPSSGYGQPARARGYGQQAPSSGYGQPTPSSGYGKPTPSSGYGQPSGGGYGGTVDCFLTYPNCVIVNTVPLEKVTMVDINQCKQKCRQANKDNLLMAECKSIVYVALYRTCYLYGITGNEEPRLLVGAFGYTYSMPTDRCDSQSSGGGGGYGGGGGQVTAGPGAGTSTATSGPSTSAPVTQGPGSDDCESGQTSIFQRAEGYRLIGSDGPETIGISEAECVEACSDNRTPDNQNSYSCLSIDYHPTGQRCVLSTEASVPARAGVLEMRADTVYYEKMCVSNSMAQACQGKELDRQPGHIMAMTGESVETVDTIGECVQLCFDAPTEFGFTCLSLMFFPEETELNCLLNRESRVTLPSGYIAEPENPVEYVGIDNCVQQFSSVLREIGESFARTTTRRTPSRLATDAPRTINRRAKLKTALSSLDNFIARSLDTSVEHVEKNTIAIRAVTVTPIRNSGQRHVLTVDRVRTLEDVRVGEQPKPPGVRPRDFFATSKDDGMEDGRTFVLGQWSRWSTCDRSRNGRKIRYRTCNATHLTLCPFETRRCSLDFGEMPGGKALLERDMTIDIISLRPSRRRRLPTSTTKPPLNISTERRSTEDEVNLPKSNTLSHKSLTSNSFSKLKLLPDNSQLSRERRAKSERLTKITDSTEETLCVPYLGSCKLGILTTKEGKRKYCSNVQSEKCQ